MNLEKLGVSPFFIGALGALVTSMRPVPGIPLYERAINITSGVLIAGFLTPMLTDWLHMNSAGYSSGAAFLLGMFGMSLAGAILRAIRDVVLADIVNRWFGRRD